MKNLLLVLALALPLSACASTNSVLTPTNLAAVESSYGVALAGAVAYRKACADRQIPSSCRAVVPQVQAYGRKAHSAVLTARQVRTVASVLAAQTAVQNFSAVTPK